MKKIFYLLIALSICLQGAAQQRSVTGYVFDVNRQPVAGATVAILGGNTGTVSSADGKFTIGVSSGQVLHISFLGYQNQEVRVGDRQNLEVILHEDINQIDDVVVVGYGTQKRSTMTASVASISSKEVGKQISSNVAGALQGRAASVDVVQSAGIAGADVNIVIRGAASLTATEPLYIIDGIFTNGGLNTVNAADIESIEILKDGAAAAIYGSRAANGVVIITTKKGAAGAPKVEINASYSFQQVTNVPDFLNAEEWRSFANMVSENSGLAPAPENVSPTDPSVNTDWADKWLQYAPVYNVNASIQGGGNVGTYSVGLGYFDQTGMTVFSDFKKYNMRASSQFKKGKFTFSENVILTYRDRTPTSAFNIALPTLPFTDEQGRKASWGEDYYIQTESARRNHPFPGLEATDQYSRTFDVVGGLTASYEIIPGLKYSMSFSGNHTTGHSYTHTPVYYTKWNADGTPDTDYGNNINSMSESRSVTLNYTWDNLLNWEKSFGCHNLSVLLGHSWLREFYRSQGYNTESDLGAENITAFSSLDGKISATERNAAMLSFFARVNYDYKNKYMFSASIRRDESSKFHKDSRVGYFPSVSAGWNVHEEPWFKNRIVSRLKITGSYGELGANFLEPYNFDPIAFGPIPYIMNNTRYVNGHAAYLKSKDLKWETSKSTDVGVELGFLNNDLTVGVNYFHKKNVDLLATINLNLSSGQIFEINTSNDTPYVNTASVENKGWEFMVNYRKQLGSDWHISASANLSTLRNKVLALGENVQPIYSGSFSGKFDDSPSVTKPGYAIGSFYGYRIDGFDHEGNFAFTDRTGDGIVNAEDKDILGSPIPDFSYGINIDLQYRNFDLTMFFNGVYGNEIFNAMKYQYYFNYANNMVRDVLNAWTPANTSTSVPVMKTTNFDGGNSLPSEFYVEDGSYFRLKNLQLGYTLPAKLTSRLNIDRARVYIGVQNVFTLTKYSGYDPEVSSNVLFSRGIDLNSYPNARTYTFGVNLTF